jgi:hypothetical protein
MATTPNVVVRMHYYDLKTAGRDFYSSGKADDYLSYIDKGIKTAGVRDYVDYAGDDEKSSGIFSAQGLLNKEEKKELRAELRATKSCIWDCVISFEEVYGKANCNNWIRAQELLEKTLPGFFKSAGLDPKKTVWYAGLHENTDNRHIHLSFFQQEPTAYDRKTKGRVFRRGKIPLEKINGFKASIEKHYLEPVEGAYRVRQVVIAEIDKAVTGSYTRDGRSFRRLVEKLYQEIPLTGDLGYESANMDACRDDIDAATDLVLENECVTPLWNKVLKEADERDVKTTEVLKAQHIDPAPYLYRPAFVKDMKRRMGNALIKELVAKRGEERRKALLLHHPKAKQRLHQRSALDLVLGAAAMSARVSQEAMDAFDEFEEKMRECEREKEEGQELV